jgi:acetyl-CoA synthetase
MKRLDFSNRDEFLRFSTDDPEAFWDAMMTEVAVEWFAPFERVLDTSRGVEWARWFIAGKLNIAHNCLDRHAAGIGANKIACIGESENGLQRSLTFAELYARASQLAHALERMGVKTGDRIALYMPMIPEMVIILCACFKLGLIVVPVFSGFGPAALATGLEDSGARILFTADGVDAGSYTVAPMRPSM